MKRSIQALWRAKKITQFFHQILTEAECIAYLEMARWGNVPICPYCQSTRTTRNDRRHYCYNCMTSFSATVGTIFHRTHLPLQKWFIAIAAMLNATKEMSALQLSRDLEVNKNTAWRVMTQIRNAMTRSDQRDLLARIVEMDETYFGDQSRQNQTHDG